MYVFQRAHVTATGKGFIAGQELPDGLLTEKQIGHLVADGLLLNVVTVKELFAAKPVEVEYENEEEIVLDPVEALDPEKKSRKKGK